MYHWCRINLLFSSVSGQSDIMQCRSWISVDGSFDCFDPTGNFFIIDCSRKCVTSCYYCYFFYYNRVELRYNVMKGTEYFVSL
jgi:hypothetical protein